MTDITDTLIRRAHVLSDLADIDNAILEHVYSLRSRVEHLASAADSRLVRALEAEAKVKALGDVVDALQAENATLRANLEAHERLAGIAHE